jgi:hypothetical protein
LAARIGNAMNKWGVIVDPPHDKGLALDALTVAVLYDGQVIAEATSEPEVIDDEYVSLSQVCRELHHRGLALEPGQQIIHRIGHVQRCAVRDRNGGCTFGALGAVCITLI